MNGARQSWTVSLVALGAGIVLATAAYAEGLKLPEPYPIPQGEGSLGQVTFIHETHVDLTKPACTGCHPTVFKILAKGAPSDGGAIAHTEMNRGAQCGTCHNDTAAFGTENQEQCLSCHKGSE